MKSIHSPILAIVLACSALASTSVMAQAAMDQGKMGSMNMGSVADMTDGEIKKLDKEVGTLTIKHDEIKNLRMPGMTMVFLVKDKALLEKVQPGDKVKFKVVVEAGKMVVTDIQPVK